MQKIEFNKNTKLPNYPFASFIFRTSLLKQYVDLSSIGKELLNHPLVLLQTNEEKDQTGKAYQLKKGNILVINKYSSWLFPTVKDFDNVLKAKAYWVKKNNEYKANNPPIADEYTKKLDTSDPRERISFRANCETFTYYQYSINTYESFLDAFSIWQTTGLKWKSDVKLTGKDDRVVFWRKGNKYGHLFLVFENNDTFLSWYNRLYDKDSSSREWKGRNPYQEKILEHKEELLQKLADLTQLKRSDIQPIKGKYHHNIHKAIKKLVFVDSTINQLFLPLVIYLGEFYMNQHGGEWHLIYKESTDTWIPIIRSDKDDYGYDIGKFIIYELLNPDESDFPPIVSVCWPKKGRTHK